MYNVLYEPLPDEWRGYKVNTWFQIGIQVLLVFDDTSLMAYEKAAIITDLLFEDVDENGNPFLRAHPTGKDLEDCIDWFLNDWHHDKPSQNADSQKVMDYFVDQWRIYADFRQFYGINLNDADLHWWEFCGLLWNMPERTSSFLQVVGIRDKKITSKMSREEREMYRDAKAVYALEQPKKEYTPEQNLKIDAFDERMAQKRKKK